MYSILPSTFILTTKIEWNLASRNTVLLTSHLISCLHVWFAPIPFNYLHSTLLKAQRGPGITSNQITNEQRTTTKLSMPQHRPFAYQRNFQFQSLPLKNFHELIPKSRETFVMSPIKSSLKIVFLFLPSNLPLLLISSLFP